ncbi:MAG: heat-inducible transcriptional repressor [Gammaproteobacteria bacterium]|jgi:heat-inducible transcriptional repressor
MTETYELDERSQILLKHLISSYTLDGQPVGSKNLAELSGLDVSSATIRTIMARLESLGLVNSPHTSAGRVPTEAGYRFFVDKMLEVNELENIAQQTISNQFTNNQTSSGLIQTATDILSSVTRLTGIVSHSHVAETEIRHLEFMKLSEKRILVILVINQDEVHNKVVQVDRDYSDQELREVTATLSHYLIGRNFSAARDNLKRELSELKTSVDSILKPVLDAMDEVCKNSAHEELITSGQSNLFEFEELSDINKLRDLFKVFNEKTDLLKLLDNCTSANGVEIFIGSESGYSVFTDYSVIGAPYQVNGQVVGVLGVIGPTRIAYEKVIPVVDITAKLLSSALNSAK